MLRIQKCHFLVLVLILGFAVAPAKLAWASGGVQPQQVAIQTPSPQQSIPVDGWFDGAVAKARERLDYSQRGSGQDSPETALSLNYLAGFLYERGDYAEAETLYARVMKIYVNKSGLTQNQDLAVSMGHIGDIMRAKRELLKAEDMYKGALEILEKVNPDSLETDVSLNGLGEISRLKHDYARAEPFYARSLEVRMKQKEKDPVNKDEFDDAEILNNLGLLYLNKGDISKAEQFFQRAITSYDASYLMLHTWRVVFKSIKTKGGRSVEYTQVAAALQNLADLYRGKGDYAAAEPLYRRALEFREKAFGAKHKLVAETLSKFALLLLAKGDKAGAAELQLRANAIGVPASDPDPSVRTDRTIAGLAGPVHTVLVESGAAAGSLVRISQTTYDSGGFLTDVLTFDEKGELARREVYQYDGGRKLTELLRYDGKNASTGKVVYAYDSDGRRIGATTYDVGGKESAKTTYANDGRGNLAHETTDTLPVIPMFTENTQFVYNSGGQLIRKLEKSALGSSETTYEYDSDGHLTQVRSEKAVDKQRISYDSAGLIKDESRTILGSEYFKTYAYEFDSQGNWIKQTATETLLRDTSATPVLSLPGATTPRRRTPVTVIVRRTITYY
ncbi:MAG: tetratricopeptide repeat protein [Pyrinomonadaceae bacterium]